MSNSTSPAKLFEEDKRSKSQDTATKKIESSERSQDEGGSIIIDPIDEPLMAINIAMENSVANNERKVAKKIGHISTIS